MHVTIRVGQSPLREDFVIPKALLCETSSYFKKALNGSFSEVKDKLIVLDEEDDNIFRTYITWLYQQHLDAERLREAFDPVDYESHLMQLCIFADKRGIPLLHNDAITLLALSTLVVGPVRAFKITEIYDTIPRGRALHRFLVDDMVHGGGDQLSNWAACEDIFDELPDEYCIDILRAQHHPDRATKRPHEHLCDYHEHEDAADRAQCEKRRRNS